MSGAGGAVGRSAGNRRRTQEERSASSRETLSRVAFELIAQEGYANFRLANVARAAGVSQGRQLHHFPNKDAISLAAVAYAIDLAESRTQANLAAFDGEKDPVRAIVEDSRDYYFSDRFHVALDVVKSASANRDLTTEIRRLSRGYRDSTERSWMDKLVGIGWREEDARDVVGLTTTLVRGFAIRRMIRPDGRGEDHLIERWIEMVHATIAAPEE